MGSVSKRQRRLEKKYPLATALPFIQVKEDGENLPSVGVCGTRREMGLQGQRNWELTTFL